MRTMILLLISISLVCCRQPARKLPYYNTADFTPRWQIPANGKFHEIRKFSLVDQENKRFTDKDMEGHITVVDFFFTTCPGICPKLARSMGDLQKEFLTDDEILLLSHSATPGSDSVPVLHAYAQKKHVNSRRWKLLTGDKNEIYDLGRKYYFIEEDEGLKRSNDIFLHTENFVLVDKQRHIRGIYNGLDGNSVQALIEDIRVLKGE